MHCIRTLVVTFLVSGICAIQAGFAQQPAPPSTAPAAQAAGSGTLIPPPAAPAQQSVPAAPSAGTGTLVPPAATPGSPRPANFPAQPSTAPPPPPKPDSEGTKLLAEAIKQLDPKQPYWLQTNFWIQGDVQGLTYQSDGLLVLGPEHRLRMDLNVQLAGTKGQLQMISDSKVFWEALKIGTLSPIIKKIVLTEAVKGVEGLSTAQSVLDESYSVQGFNGIYPMLAAIQERMVVTGKESSTLNGRPATKLTATWSVENDNQARQVLSPQTGQTAGMWPAHLAQTCFIYLERVDSGKRLWPARIEWWGPSPPRSGNVLMLQLEFRDPKFDPLTAQESARLFHFEPKNAEVVDMTKAYAENIKKQAQSMLPKTAPAAPAKDTAPPKDTTGPKETTPRKESAPSKDSKDSTP
jgi:hypothetical protein